MHICVVNEGFNHIQPDHSYLSFAFDIVNKEITAERPLPHNMSHSQIFKCTLVESDINKVTLDSVNRRWKVWQTNILLNQPKNLYKHEAHAFIRRKITTYRPFSCYVHANLFGLDAWMNEDGLVDVASLTSNKLAIMNDHLTTTNI